ncbi:MAG: circadian clock protein KaiC [Candidatus Thermoplasmatota archaeon]|nr:circadian clock protein KaiC [Euryarchaeota archaeon]MBU4032807.1 circadian clock protein KaiC [Candidatus Thermoplasmatota archaeon]MBU4071602.1 circadian clock protein KaiC [Candidatus Thermoplasmatota archaeon]MBU4144362.1 circadian clock protein KaiC [Candidatus Thermoplasmatota archaeon]MBU4592834.1 circadian clock protein KaiC [Candidatus Thermoplasmatota archaeon]
MKKIKSGVYGLNRLMDGGINQNTITAVIGSSGAGKTTFATYFLKRGLEQGEDAIFITLDEEPKQIIKEVIQMGWDNIEDYIDDGAMVFVDAGGKQFSDFIKNELSGFVEDWKGYNARIVIDPLTPVLWSVTHRYEQRDIVSFLLRETRKIGTVICTLEEHSVMGDLSGQDLIIPMYLADNVVHLRYKSHESPEHRDMKIIKCRSSRHSSFWHPYKIVKGSGLIIQEASLAEDTPRQVVDLSAKLEKALTLIPASKKKNLSPSILRSITRTVDMLSMEDIGVLDPDYIIMQILVEYDLIDK